MEAFTIDIEERKTLSKGELRRLRSAGYIPAIVYQKGGTAVSVQVEKKPFVLMARQSNRSQLFQLKSQSKNLDGKRAVVREVQKNYCTGEVVHVDFHALREDEKQHFTVAVHLNGEAPGVKLSGGVLSFVSHTVEVSCFPSDIPPYLNLDISNLQMGQSLHASDIVLPKGIEIKYPEETIVTVAAVRGADEATPATTEVKKK